MRFLASNSRRADFPTVITPRAGVQNVVRRHPMDHGNGASVLHILVSRGSVCNSLWRLTVSPRDRRQTPENPRRSADIISAGESVIPCVSFLGFILNTNTKGTVSYGSRIGYPFCSMHPEVLYITRVVSGITKTPTSSTSIPLVASHQKTISIIVLQYRCLYEPSG